MEKSITFCNADKHTIKRSVPVLFMISRRALGVFVILKKYYALLGLLKLAF